MDAERHKPKVTRTSSNHMGTALDIQFDTNGKTYDDIRRDIFCKYMGAPLKGGMVEALDGLQTTWS